MSLHDHVVLSLTGSLFGRVSTVMAGDSPTLPCSSLLPREDSRARSSTPNITFNCDVPSTVVHRVSWATVTGPSSPRRRRPSDTAIRALETRCGSHTYRGTTASAVEGIRQPAPSRGGDDRPVRAFRTRPPTARSTGSVSPLSDTTDWMFSSYLRTRLGTAPRDSSSVSGPFGRHHARSRGSRPPRATWRPDPTVASVALMYGAWCLVPHGPDAHVGGRRTGGARCSVVRLWGRDGAVHRRHPAHGRAVQPSNRVPAVHLPTVWRRLSTRARSRRGRVAPADALVDAGLTALDVSPDRHPTVPRPSRVLVHEFTETQEAHELSRGSPTRSRGSRGYDPPRLVTPRGAQLDLSPVMPRPAGGVRLRTWSPSRQWRLRNRLRRTSPVWPIRYNYFSHGIGSVTTTSVTRFDQTKPFQPDRPETRRT